MISCPPPPQFIGKRLNLVGLPPSKLGMLESMLDVSQQVARDILRQVHRNGIKYPVEVTGLSRAKLEQLTKYFTIREWQLSVYCGVRGAVGQRGSAAVNPG